MNARLPLGATVTVDEESELIDLANRSLHPGQDSNVNREGGGQNPMLGDAESPFTPSFYKVIGFDLSSSKVILKSKVGADVTRTVSIANVINADDHIKDIALSVVAKHRETNIPKAKLDEPIAFENIDPDAKIEAQRRTEIMSRHCSKTNPISKAQSMKELGLGPTIFHRVKRIHLTNPDWTAQLPGQSGRRPGEKRIDPDVDQIIQAVFITHRTGYGANDAGVMDEIGLRCSEANKNAPSRSTVWRRWQEISARERLQSSDGSAAANAKFGAFPTPRVEKQYPGRIHEIDHTPLDCHAIDSKTGEPLGRPYLTLVRDVDTEGIYGFALLYGAPKRASISAAIHMALCPKSSLLERLGMSSLHWPLYGKPEQYRVDHGSDLQALSFRLACDGEDIDHCSRLRPQSGGGIERQLGILNRGLSQTLDGGTASAPKKGAGYRPGEKAVYTLERLTAIIVAWICKWNNRKGRDGLSPNERFERKYGVHDGVIIAPPTVSDPDRFVIDILETKSVKVARNGVVTRDLVYEFGPFKSMVGQEIMIKIDPNNLHRIWGLNGNYWHPLNIVNIHDSAKTLSEQKLILKARRADRSANRKRLDAQAELNRQKDMGKTERRIILRAQEDVAQNNRMGHFGSTSDSVPSESPPSPKSLPVVIMEMDEEL